MPIVILFLSANPVEGAYLKVDQEAKEIDHKLAEGRYRDHFQLVKEPGVSIDDIQYLLLERRPNIVHFSGHGEVDAVYLQGPDGKAQKLSGPALSELFEVVNRNGNIRCVVLNACYSEEQAASISEHVDAVVGMSEAISDDGARGFASSFYQGLAFGSSVKDSFLLGANYLRMMGVAEEQIPKLHCRQGVDPAKMFLDAGPKSEAAPPTNPDSSRLQLTVVGNWDANGSLRSGYFQSPMVARIIFYSNGTFEESGTVGGSPFYAKGNYSFDPVRSLLVTQEYGAPFPTTFFLSALTADSFTANAPAGMLNFKRSG